MLKYFENFWVWVLWGGGGGLNDHSLRLLYVQLIQLHASKLGWYVWLNPEGWKRKTEYLVKTRAINLDIGLKIVLIYDVSIEKVK